MNLPNPSPAVPPFRACALIVAGGEGRRTRLAVPKQYALLHGMPVLRHTVRAFLQHSEIADVLVVRPPIHSLQYKKAMHGLTLLDAADAGETRQASVRNGLLALEGQGYSHVLIHDAARPFVSADIIDRVVTALKDGAQAVLPGIAVMDTLKRIEGNAVKETLPREDFVTAQTPQGFDFDIILNLHRQASGDLATDDAALAEQAGIKVVTVEGEQVNRKLTTVEDMQTLSAAPETRTGSGFDAHRFAPTEMGAAEVNETVRLCGVDVPHTQRLEGHSDADVGLHALTDAILGALSAGDIGSHFPPSDMQWRGADSAQFLAHAARLAAEKNARILHVDVTIICEAPKVGPHREAMRARIAEILGLSQERVSVKATTTEGMGFTGRAEGIAAQAVASVQFHGNAQ